MTNGSCLCGDVAWEISTPFTWMTHCHCGMCRKAHGTAFGTFVGTSASGLHWLRGRAGVVHWESSPGNARPFCGRCGSRVPSEWRGEVAIAAGVLEGELGVRPGAHIFTGSKAPWWEIAGDLPRALGSPSASAELAAMRATEPAPGSVRGACACGAVAYQVDAPLAGEIWCCHCTRCQKAHAAAHAANAFVPKEQFRWLRGAERIRSYKVPEAQRYTQFCCEVCGAGVPAVRAERPLVVIPAGTFEDDPGIRPGRHIFVSSKAAWDEICDAVPQYAEYAPSIHSRSRRPRPRPRAEAPVARVLRSRCAWQGNRARHISPAARTHFSELEAREHERCGIRTGCR